jgi:hypothetical protein
MTLATGLLEVAQGKLFGRSERTQFFSHNKTGIPENIGGGGIRRPSIARCAEKQKRRLRQPRKYERAA